MNLEKYKAHGTWATLKDLYIDDAAIKDWESFTGINPKYRMVFEIEGNKFNDWIFTNFTWYVEIVMVQFLDQQWQGKAEDTMIPDDLEIINAQLRAAPAILARLDVMFAEVDCMYRRISGVIWKACPENYTIEDRQHELKYFVSYMRMVKKKIEAAHKNVNEKIQILKKAQDKAMANYMSENSAARRSQPTREA